MCTSQALLLVNQLSFRHLSLSSPAPIRTKRGGERKEAKVVETRLRYRISKYRSRRDPCRKIDIARQTVAHAQVQCRNNKSSPLVETINTNDHELNAAAPLHWNLFKQELSGGIWRILKTQGESAKIRMQAWPIALANRCDLQTRTS